MKVEIKTIGHGLVPHAEDKRDIPFGSIFSMPKLSDLPASFLVSSPIKIKDQLDTDRCAAYAGTAVSEDQEETELSPEWQFYQAKKIQGKMDEWGCDLRSMALSFVKKGSLPKRNCDYDASTARSVILDPKNWNMNLETLAASFKKQSFMFVKGPYDFFDNCRATLWKNRKDKESILTGTIWHMEWIDAPMGLISSLGRPLEGHALKIYGWTVMNGNTVLVAQLSNGENIGNRGIFYFTREVINQCFTFGGVIFTDLPKERARFYLENGIKHDDNIFVKLFKRIIFLIKQI